MCIPLIPCHPPGNLFGSTNPRLYAKKFWVFFDEGWVALGTNITASASAGADNVACTTLEQNLLQVIPSILLCA
jgi:hypothetical protein